MVAPVLTTNEVALNDDDIDANVQYSDPSFWDDIGGFLNSSLGKGIGTLAAKKLGWLDPQIHKVGYQGKIPQYTAVRDRVPTNALPADMEPRRPGAGGRRSFSDTRYATDAGLPAARAAAQAQAQQLAAAQQGFAAGGLATLQPPQAQPQQAGRFMRSPADGMSDQIPAEIDGQQPAALGGGEFVIPADVVSHLGNGNSEAGAAALKRMMERVRKERTGNPEQGKQINPDAVMGIK